MVLNGLVLLFLVCATALGQNYTLVWEDNFDFLDTSKWDHEITAAGGGVMNSICTVQFDILLFSLVYF